MITYSREWTTDLCVYSRVNARGRQANDRLSSTSKTSSFQLEKTSSWLRSIASAPPTPVFPHFSASPPRFRAQELRGEQQRRRTERQPSDSRQGLLGLDGFWPPQRRGVRILFVMPPHPHPQTPFLTLIMVTRKNRKKNKHKHASWLLTILQHESIYDVFVVYLFVKL